MKEHILRSAKATTAFLAAQTSSVQKPLIATSNQQPGSTTCASEETGGTNGGVYPDCEFTNWPWVGKDMDEDEEEEEDED